jgi:hypothetical protein
MILVMIAFFIFNIFHFWITINNFTTYEFVTQVVRKKEKKDRYMNADSGYYHVDRIDRMNKKSLFDVSPWDNWKQVYGTNPLLWLIPFKCRNENSLWYNGINFKVNRKYEFEVVKSV